MPYYTPPETPEDKLFVLEETLNYCAAEAVAGRLTPVKDTTLTEVGSFAPGYRSLVAGRTAALGGRTREVEESVTAKAALEEIVRDYIEVLKRRTRRKRHNVAVLVNHGLNEAGDVPVLSNWAALKQVAEALIAGNVQSSAAYTAMQNPTGPEVQTALTAAQAEHDDVAPADSALQAAQSALEAQATQVDYWISEIRYDALDFARREDEPGKRRLLRKLGFKFNTLPGETPEDPGDVPPPPPAP